jgi:hypothetical protein
MKELRTEYMRRTYGDYSAAAVELAYDLMQDDPATLKAGYTLENAAIAAHEVFPKFARIAIQERVARRVGLIK